MTGYFFQRLALFIPTLILVSFLVFAIMRFLPGDPAIALLSQGGAGSYTEEDVQRMRERLGTDKQYHVQYWEFIRGLATWDLGESFEFTGVPVSEMLETRFPLSVELALLALILSYAVAVPLGVLSAVKQDSWVDGVSRVFTVGGIALPPFVVGLLTIFILARFFEWLPPLGYAQIWADPLTNLQQLIFPAMALGFYNMALIARVTRSAMLEVFREDYIRTARSKGLSERVVIIRHALKNASLPVLTISGWQIGRLLAGTVVIEKIFLVPGIGRLLIDSIFARDFTMIQAIVMMVATMVLLLNLVIDLMYGWLDPRIRYA